MILDLSSQMLYNEPESMLAFWGDHAMAHAAIASRLGSRLTLDVDVSVAFGSGVVIASSVFDLADQGALSQWVSGMADPENAESLPESLREWLLAHQALHVAEMQALNGTTPFDLSVLDVRNEGQVFEWHDTHSRLHRIETQALGIQ